MFENFTPGAIKVISLAQEETRRFRQKGIGSEQLLLGLIAEGSGSASKILKAAGVSFQAVHAEIEKSNTPASEPGGLDISFAPDGQQVMDIAAQEAKRLGSTDVGTEHLLLGLIKQADNRALVVLKSLGVDANRLRPQVEQMAMHVMQQSGTTPRSFFYACFVDRADELIMRANEECLRDGSEMVGTEHVLLALISDTKFAGGDPLRKREISPDAVRAVVSQSFHAEKALKGSETQRANRYELSRALGDAFAEAVAMDDMIGTGHIMLGLIKHPGNRAGQVLGKLNVDLNQIVVETNELLRAKRDEGANLWKTVSWSIKTLTGESPESRKPLSAKHKLEAEELLAIIDKREGNLHGAEQRIKQLILFRGGDQSPEGQKHLKHHLAQLAAVYVEQERFDEARSAAERSMSMAGASGGTDDPVWIASLLNTMALMHIRKGEFREAQGFLEKANTIAADPKNRDLDLILSAVQNNIGDCLRAQGNLAGSKEFLLKALESANRLNAPDDPQLAYNHVNLGKLLMAMDRFVEAQTCFQKALALQQPLDPTHPDIALTLREYAPLLEMLKQPTEAAAARKRAEEIRAINLNQLVKANE